MELPASNGLVGNPVAQFTRMRLGPQKLSNNCQMKV